MTSLDIEELIDHRSNAVNRSLTIFADHVHWAMHAHLALGLRKFKLGSGRTRRDNVCPLSDSQRLGWIGEEVLVVEKTRSRVCVRPCGWVRHEQRAVRVLGHDLVGFNL